jgi:hypothetical protein
LAAATGLTEVLRQWRLLPPDYCALMQANSKLYDGCEMAGPNLFASNMFM